jgi:hypothetical protein
MERPVRDFPGRDTSLPRMRAWRVDEDQSGHDAWLAARRDRPRTRRDSRNNLRRAPLLDLHQARPGAPRDTAAWVLQGNRAMAAIEDIVDFYIVLYQFASIEREQWLVCAKPASNCLAVHEDVEAAIAHARRMADYRITAGKAAQIHVRHESAGPWRTVWCSANCTPRYP